MDIKDLNFEELKNALNFTPDIVVLNLLSKEISKFGQHEQDELWRIYHINYNQFRRPVKKVRLLIGKLTLYWQGTVPYAEGEASDVLQPGYVNEWRIDNLLAWIKSNMPMITDVRIESRWDRLMGINTAPEIPPSNDQYVGRKLQEQIDSFIKVPSVDMIDDIRQQDEEEIIREREIDEALRKNKEVPENVIHDVVAETKEEVKKIRNIIKKPIPPEVHDLYMRYIGVKPNYINERAFAVFLKRILTAFPNYETQEILDRVDFGSVIEAIKEGKKYGEYMQEAFDDLLRRMKKNTEDVETQIEQADELNMRIEIFSKLLDLLFRIYAEYKREEDKDAQRAILRVLCENFDICSEEAIENVRKNPPEWLVTHIDYLY